MEATEVLRIVDTIHRDKDIDKEIIFQGLEQALQSAARKRRLSGDTVAVVIDRETGVIQAFDDTRELDPIDLGRIAALTAKQVLIQKIREAERDVIYNEFENRRNQLVTGTVSRLEGPNLIVNLGKVEGIVTKKEQVFGETYKVGDRIKLFILNVKKVGQKVKIFLSRSHPRLVKALFDLEIPEIQERIIEVKAIAREPGFRTKIAVTSIDARVDCVGACVGVRGARIKNIVDELNGEKIDIVRWNDSAEVLIVNALKPAEISEITLDHDNMKATVVVEEDQLSLAIGKRGQNVRLAAKLSGWDINITTPSGTRTGDGLPSLPAGVSPLDALLAAPTDAGAAETASTGTEGVEGTAEVDAPAVGESEGEGETDAAAIEAAAAETDPSSGSEDTTPVTPDLAAASDEEGLTETETPPGTGIPATGGR